MNYYGNCPFCNFAISGKEQNRSKNSNSIEDLHEDEEDFFQCIECKNFFKASFDIVKEYYYEINKPTKEEIKIYKLKDKDQKKIIKDIPGQKLMWE